MAEDRDDGQCAKLQEDELALKLISRDSPGSDAVLLTGYMGKGLQDGRWRLYKAPDLTEYVEFGEEDVIHCEKTKSDLFPARASLVWLRGDAKLIHQKARSSRLAAEFLSGRLVEEQRCKTGFDLFLIADLATWTVTATAAGIPTPTPGSGGVCTGPPLCALAPPSIGMCGSGCNVCGNSVPS
jgi:hypothetical protein